MDVMTSDKDLFSCTLCGDCCRGFGGTYVTDEDIAAIAAFLDMTAADFKEKYCVFSGTRLLIKQGANGYCALWDKACTIHSVKPKMCRRWPFIDSLLVDIGNWRIMADSCPGMRTDISDADLNAKIREILNGREDNA